MFIRISLKKKIIIFSIAAVIGGGIVIHAGVDKYHYNHEVKNIGNNLPMNSAITGTDTKEALGQDEELKEKQVQQQEEDKKKEDQQKQLEDKYNTAFDAFHNKNYNDAINISDDIISTDAGFYKAYSIKGISQCYSSNYIEGMQNIDKALEIKSDYGYGLFNKALALELYAHYDEALQWYDKALSVENYIWSYYGKASIYGRKGDAVNAAANLKTAMAMDSSVLDLAKEEPDFDNVRDSEEFKELFK